MNDRNKKLILVDLITSGYCFDHPQDYQKLDKLATQWGSKLYFRFIAWEYNDDDYEDQEAFFETIEMEDCDHENCLNVGYVNQKFELTNAQSWTVKSHHLKDILKLDLIKTLSFLGAPKDNIIDYEADEHQLIFLNKTHDSFLKISFVFAKDLLKYNSKQIGQLLNLMQQIKKILYLKNKDLPYNIQQLEQDKQDWYRKLLNPNELDNEYIGTKIIFYISTQGKLTKIESADTIVVNNPKLEMHDLNYNLLSVLDPHSSLASLINKVNPDLLQKPISKKVKVNKYKLA